MHDSKKTAAELRRLADLVEAGEIIEENISTSTDRGPTGSYPGTQTVLNARVRFVQAAHARAAAGRSQ
jgi:hypothetical protein